SGKIINLLNQNRLPTLVVNGTLLLPNQYEQHFNQVIAPFITRSDELPKVHLLFLSEPIICSHIVNSLHAEKGCYSQGHSFLYVRHTGLNAFVPVRTTPNYTFSKIREEACRTISSFQINWSSNISDVQWLDK